MVSRVWTESRQYRLTGELKTKHLHHKPFGAVSSHIEGGSADLHATLENHLKQVSLSQELHATLENHLKQVSLLQILPTTLENHLKQFSLLSQELHATLENHLKQFSLSQV